MRLVLFIGSLSIFVFASNPGPLKLAIKNKIGTNAQEISIEVKIEAKIVKKS